MKLNMYVLILLAVVATTSTFIQTGKSATALPTVYVNPPTKTIPLGDHFSIDVDLTNASNLYGYDIWLSFDPGKLNATALEYKNYLNEPTVVWAHTINDTGGYVDFVITSQNPAPPKNGGSPPPLVTINFTAKAPGTSPLDLENKTGLASAPYGAPIPHQTSNGTVTVLPAAPVAGVAGMVGITGYKLVFGENLSNTSGSPVSNVGYWWSYAASDGTNGATTEVYTTVSTGVSSVMTGSIVLKTQPAWNTTIDVTWSFNWNISGTIYTIDYGPTALNVHAADIAGKAVAFPYLGADGNVGTKDLHVLGVQWGLSSVGTDPTSDVARADINGDGSVGTKDLHILGVEWGQAWTNSAPPG